MKVKIHIIMGALLCNAIVLNASEPSGKVAESTSSTSAPKNWWEMAKEYTPGYGALGTGATAGLVYSGGLKKMIEQAKNAGLSEAAFNALIASKDLAGRGLSAFGGAAKEGLSALTYTDYLKNIGDTTFGAGTAAAGIGGLSYYLYNNPGAIEYLKKLFKTDCTTECADVCKKEGSK